MITPLIALVLGAIGLGGGIYETLTVDKAWPENLAIIQPLRGGLDRKLCWIPVHTAYELSPSEIPRARRWIRLSRCRPILEMASIIALGAAIVQLGLAGR